MVMTEAKKSQSPVFYRKGKLKMGFSEKVYPYACTLSLLYVGILHSTGQKKLNI